MSKWNKELAFGVAMQYESLKDFYTNEKGCYEYAKRSNILKDMTWLKRKYKVLTHENVIEESKKYESRGDFCNGSHSHYTYARRHNLLDEMYWLKPKTNKHENAHCIYAYLDEENKVAYVGQTMRLVDRDKEHRTNKKSSVFKYFDELKKEIPHPIVLERNLQDKQAQVQEDYWAKEYKRIGYELLNKAKTGLHCSSLGLCRIKWSKGKTIREANKYKSSGEFKNGNEPAYQIACRKGWMQEIAKNNGWNLRIKWTHETCFFYAGKCEDKVEFRKKYQAGYKYARKHNLLYLLKWKNTNIFTSCSQSYRLRLMGLRGNTCDYVAGYGVSWSIHRLLELYLSNKPDKKMYIRKLTIDRMIDIIERDIKDGSFNQDFLQEPPADFDEVLNGRIKTSLFTITKNKYD